MGKKLGEELKNALAVTADQCVSGFVQMFLCSIFCCCHYLDVLTLTLLQHHPQKLLLVLAVGAGRFGVISACIPLQDVEHKKPSVVLLLWERFLPGITNNWWQPWEVQEGKRAVLGLEHRGERNWSPEYQQAAERGLSSARAEQHCTQEVGSCWYWGLVLTSIMAQHCALLV